VLRVVLEISSGSILCALHDARINFSSSNFIHGYWLILMQCVWLLYMGIG